MVPESRSIPAGLIRLLFYVVIILSSLISSLPGEAVAGATAVVKYSPLKIAEGILAKPGTMSWSPDGKSIAFIRKTLNIYDTETGKRRELSIKEPLFVSWWTWDEILLIYREDGRNFLCTVDAVTLKLQELKLDMEADAVFPAPDGRRLFLVQSRIKHLSIGTDVHFNLFVFDRKERTTKSIQTFGRTLPFKNPGGDYLNGWLHAGLNPLDGSLFIMEHIKPPIGKHYSKISAVDLVTGKLQVVTDNGRVKSNIAGSWSPDGRRLALSDADGYLEMFDGRGVSLQVDQSSPGLYPSWNPRGSQIFIGGYVMDSDGKNKEELLASSAKSLARWSPDGTKIAILSNGALWLLKDFAPHFIPQDKPLDEALSKKLLLLKELVNEGLLTESEYQERYDRLMKEKGN
jgi:hypothetical protein